MIPGGYRLVEYPSRSDEIDMYITGDWHETARACAHERLEQDLREIGDNPRGVWFGTGDYSDAIGVRDKRFDTEAYADDVLISDLGKFGMVSVKRIERLMRPIRGKCLGLLYGNHELTMMKMTEGRQLHAWLCTQLGVPCLNYSTIFQLRFSRNSHLKDGTIRLSTWMPGNPPLMHGTGHTTWTVTIFAHHGAGAAQTPGGKLNKLRAAMDFFPYVDLTILAHVHEQKCEPSTVLTTDPDCTEIREHTRKGVISGTYLRTYVDGEATYPEERLYRPVPLGMARVSFTPDKKKFEVVM